MKLAVCTSTISRNAGGLFESVRHLHQTLGETCDTRLFASTDEFTEEDLPKWAPLRCEVAPAVGPKSFAYSPRLQSALREFSPDVTHVHGIWQGSSLQNMRHCVRYSTPYVVSPRGMLDPWALNNSAWKKKIILSLFEQKHLAGASCLHALCESEFVSIREAGFTNPVAIIPNGVKRRDDTSSIPTRKRVLLFIGRLHPKKGLENAIRAWSQCHEELNDWILVIAGWNQLAHREVLQNLASDLGIPWESVLESGENPPNETLDGLPSRPSLVFWGPVYGREKDNLLLSAGAFILPSKSEGLPMSVLEAWSYGVPCFLTPECNLPEGFEFDAAIPISSDPNNISSQLRSALHTDARHTLATIGENGKQLANTRFCWAQIAEKMRQTYDWILGQNAVPPWVRLDH